MRLLEDVTKDRLRRAGIAVPEGRAARDADDAQAAARDVAGAHARVAVKALVPGGRRGKAGAVVVCAVADARDAALAMLGRRFGDATIERVYVEQAVDIAEELYASFVFGALAPRLLVSREGGVEIERLAHERPGALVVRDIDPIEGLRTWHAATAWDDAGVPSAQVPALARLTVQLYEAWRDADGLMLELNPVAITHAGELAVVGAMLEIDDNALYRHPSWDADAAASAGPGGRPLTPGELAVARANRELPGGATRYVELDGDIGLLVSGGGASLYQHDLIVAYGGRPANHTDFSPSPTPDKQVAVLDAIFGKPGVRGLLVGCNHLQLARCDLVVEALAIALEKHRIDARRFPIVVRLFGPGEDRAREIAARFPGIRYLPAGATLAQACREIVEAVNATHDAGANAPPADAAKDVR